MSKLIDLTGQRFGRWVVLEKGNSDKNCNTKWKCQCDCGTIKEVAGTSLRKGTSTSCGCYKKENSKENNGKFINEIGNRYGRLVVIAKDEEASNKNHRAYWICKCDCGNIKSVSSKCLRDGKTKSCGCLISVGEENITKLLNLFNIQYQSQYGVAIKDKWYRYDFAIFNKNKDIVCLLEYNGIQHYDDQHKHWGNDISINRERDLIKANYALDTLQIPLEIIRYDEDIENKLISILNKYNLL